MSGKLIMKRKLDKSRQEPTKSYLEDENSSSSSSSASSSSHRIQATRKRLGNNSNFPSPSREPIAAAAVNHIEHNNKRLRCADTPPSEPEDLDLPQINARNRHLLEAIQLKMLELQNELDAFEQDFEAREEYIYNNDNGNQPPPPAAAAHHPQPDPPQMSEEEAEAIGFAMCAQETMLFLQREGISNDSILYTRLREALVGRGGPENRDRIFQL